MRQAYQSGNCYVTTKQLLNLENVNLLRNPNVKQKNELLIKKDVSANSQNFLGLYPEPHWGPSEYDPKPPAPKLRNSQFGPYSPNWKFRAHTLFM